MSKNKLLVLTMVFVTVILAGIAIFTAIKLYQSRGVAVAPNAPLSEPKALFDGFCQISFTITGPTKPPIVCNSKCTTDSQCPSNLKCMGEEPGAQKYCKNPDCFGSANCVCSTTTVLKCNSVCTSNSQCQAGLKCLSVSSGSTVKRCRNLDCSTRNDCICPTSTPIIPQCNSVCSTNSDCPSSLICFGGSGDTRGYCRKSACTGETDCLCPGQTATPTATATGTSEPTETPTATATATANPECNNSCTQNTDCPDGLMCNIPSGETMGSCRNTSCLSETDCLCPVATATSTTTTSVAEEPELPDAGTSWPTIIGTAFGMLIILGSLLLAF